MIEQVDYEILGGDMQIFEMELDPGETIIALSLKLIGEFPV